MNQEKKEFLSLVMPPARLGINETAWLLGFNEHDIPVLVSGGLLKPLGRPTATGSKYFAAVELQSLRNDIRWLAKASDAIVNHWRSKNVSRRPVTTALNQHWQKKNAATRKTSVGIRGERPAIAGSVASALARN